MYNEYLTIINMNATLKKIIFNRPAFYAFLVLVTLSIIGLLCYAQCNPEPLPTAEEITQDTPYNSPVEFPKKIYIADTDRFTTEQIQLMKNGLADWNRATKGVFDITLVEDWDPPKAFSRDYEFYDKITLWRRNVNDIEYAYLALQHTFFSGVAKGNMIVLTDDSEYTDEEFEIIFKHEVGHIVGLGHLKEEYPGLMHIGGNKGVITKYDLILFCNTYSCKDGTL